MKKILSLTNAIIILLIASPVFSQNSIKYGIDLNEDIVKYPILYWDVLHNNSKGWLWEKKNSNSNIWETFEKTRNIKDVKGRYTVIETKRWNVNTLSWNKPTAFYYDYQENTLGQVEEIILNTSKGSSDLIYKYQYIYDGLKLLQIKTEEKLDNSLDSFKNTNNRYFIYNSIGQRVKDSLVYISPFNLQIIINDFNKNNKLIKASILNPFITGDTLYYFNYNYNANNNLISYSYFKENPLTENSRGEYLYNSNGKVESAIYFRKDSDQLIPASYYKHFYNNQSKVKAMVFKRFNSNWQNQDSIVINYLPNGDYDTCFIYKGSGTTWNDEHSERLLFNPVSLNVKKRSKPITSIAAYPNPVTNKIILEINSQKSGDFHIIISDLLGKEIIKQEVANHNQPIKVDISLAKVPKGMYIISIGEEYIKIIKE